MSTPPGIAIRAENLTKVYGAGSTAVRAVNDVALTIEQGRLALIMGPSGSGKTTLLSMLGGLLRPTSGRVFLGDLDITELSESKLPRVRAERIGFIFQAFNLLSSLTAEENILFPAGLLPHRPPEVRERARATMERLGLSHRARHLPRDLSGGEKQRVAIARALINNPGVILADEPTGNLDSKSGHEVMMILYDLVKDQNRTVVIVTHNPLLEEMADKVLWIEDGKLRDRKDEAHSWVKDPVCGMPVDQWTATFFRDWQRRRFVFCSNRCRERFGQEPDRYAQSAGQPEGR
jgi:putative ABC transport system ATP-binding protein